MKKAVPVILAVVVALVLVLVGISRKGSDSDQLEIAVIPKGTSHIFWESIRLGAEQACEEEGAKMYWNGPEREGDREKQIQIIEDFVVKQVDGVVLAPLDDKALVPSVETLSGKGIPCVIIDSSIDTDEIVSFVATDNYKGGVLAAREMARLLDGKGEILVIKYAPGSASTTKRENGFIETIESEFPDIEIIDSKFGMDTVETALQATEDLLTKNPDFDGIYACNESTTTGTLRALQQRGLAGKVKFVGFDSSTPLINAMRNDELQALVVQNPTKMGYLGTKTLINHINGNPVEKVVDTGVDVVTKSRLTEPAIIELLGLKPNQP